MIYYRFKLDTSSEKNRRKINPTKARALEKMLKDRKLVTISSSTGTNGARDSLIIGANTIGGGSLTNIQEIISDLDLPYVHKESYS